MKKLLSTILIIALIMCMTSCVNKDDTSKTTDAAKQTEISGNENTTEELNDTSDNSQTDNDETESATEDFDESMTDVQSNDESATEEEMTEENIFDESVSPSQTEESTNEQIEGTIEVQSEESTEGSTEVQTQEQTEMVETTQDITETSTEEYTEDVTKDAIEDETDEVADETTEEDATIAWWDYADNPFTLIINDVEYHFPMSYEEFTNMGWTPKDVSLTAEQVGEMFVDGDYPNTSSAYLVDSECGIPFKTDGLDAIWLLFCNRTGEKQKVKDCQVIGLQFNDVLLREYKIQAGVIKIEKDGKYAVPGQTTLGELCEYFGESLFYSMSGESELEMTYYYDDFYANYNWATYLTSDENGVVQRFKYCCSY